ncbi:MAG: hypothetical protein OEV00_13980, partial [Acidobacteriota bacterium]|nr:hypothetical protein [Acidobacteriota bacterium]
KRDVLGAIDAVERLAPQARDIGIFGVGMGAQAAVLAAGDRSTVRVLVLDRLDREPEVAMQQTFFSGWEFASDRLAFLPRRIFGLMHDGSAQERAENRIDQLPGRSVLMLAPANDPRLTEEMKSLVRRIPDDVESDGNLVVLPTTLGNQLYGDQLDRYHERVSTFFRERLRG